MKISIGQALFPDPSIIPTSSPLELQHKLSTLNYSFKEPLQTKNDRGLTVIAPKNTKTIKYQEKHRLNIADFNNTQLRSRSPILSQQVEDGLDLSILVIFFLAPFPIFLTSVMVEEAKGKASGSVSIVSRTFLPTALAANSRLRCPCML